MSRAMQTADGKQVIIISDREDHVAAVAMLINFVFLQPKTAYFGGVSAEDARGALATLTAMDEDKMLHISKGFMPPKKRPR